MPDLPPGRRSRQFVAPIIVNISGVALNPNTFNNMTATEFFQHDPQISVRSCSLPFPPVFLETADDTPGVRVHGNVTGMFEHFEAANDRCNFHSVARGPFLAEVSDFTAVFCAGGIPEGEDSSPTSRSRVP